MWAGKKPSIAQEPNNAVAGLSVRAVGDMDERGGLD